MTIFEKLLRKYLGRQIVAKRGEVIVMKIGGMLTMSIGGKLTQSVLDTTGKFRKQVWYFYLFAPYFLPAMPTRPSVLVLGFGAGTFAKSFLSLHPKSQITGVEINPDVIAMAKQYFDLPTSISVVQADAITFAKENQTQRDIILADVCDTHGTIAQVGSPDFLSSVLDRLKNPGVLIINCVGPNVVPQTIIDFCHNKQYSVFAAPLRLYGIVNTVLFITPQATTLSDVMKRLQNHPEPKLLKLQTSFLAALQEV